MPETRAKTKAEEPTLEAPTVSDADMLRAAVIDALRTIETDVAAQWGNEKFNEGARAAAQVLRAKVGLGAEEALPAVESA